MFLGEAGFDVLMGILTVSVVLAMSAGVVLVLVFIRREANLSELQADFVSKVSHELRTPLTAIRLFVETLDRSKDDPETQAECVRMLTAETERLSRRIERLLDWGRMEAGRKLYDLRPTSVDDIVREARGPLLALAHRRGLRLRGRRGAGPPDGARRPGRRSSTRS